MNQKLINNIDEASKFAGKTWPLYTFVASNPLYGSENSTFCEAINSAKKNFNANDFPATQIYQQAWKKGDIDKDVLTILLNKNDLPKSPEFYLQLLKSKNKSEVVNESHAVESTYTVSEIA